MTYRPTALTPIVTSPSTNDTFFSSLTATAAAPPDLETRALLTFPTTGLPSPKLVPASCFPPSREPLEHLARDPTSALTRTTATTIAAFSPSAAHITQLNRWLCCRCADSGYGDPVGMVHISPLQQQQQQPTRTSSHCRSTHGPPVPPTNPNSHPVITAQTVSSYSICWRPPCHHPKCPNCALFSGPSASSSDPSTGHGKLLIRTVGGLHFSPRFIDPVYWECNQCGEWVSNQFDGSCVLGRTRCSICGREPTHVLGVWWRGHHQPQRGRWGGGGMLTGQSVVRNRYGQRLGTADQRVAVADGPWDWQRRGLGDARCAVVAGLRAVMKKGVIARPQEGLLDDEESSRIPVWKQGEPAPNYRYRRPPPVNEDEVKENQEYEYSYLEGMPIEPRDKGKEVEKVYELGPGPASAAYPRPRSAASPMGHFTGWGEHR